MEKFKVISVSEDRVEKQRSDNKESRAFVSVRLGSYNPFDQRVFVRNMYLHKHAADGTLIGLKTTGDQFRKMAGQSVNAEAVTVNHTYDIDGRTVNTWTGLLFDFELSSEAARTQALSKLMPKATVIAEVAEEVPADIRA